MFPTRHWRKIQNSINPQTIVQIAHGLRDGRNGTAIIPDVVEFEMGVANYDTWPNQSIGKGLADDNTYIYLANFDTRANHAYSVVVRSFYSDDDINF